MSKETENLVRAYRTLWRQEADDVDAGRLAILRDGQDVSLQEAAKYRQWADDASTMLDRAPDA